MNDETILDAAQTAFGITLDAVCRGKLRAYADVLKAWSNRVRLISRGDREHIWERHILDCLSIVPRICRHGPALDLGSGAGFPGIPVAIAMPDTHVFLVESARMKTLFLKHVVSELSLDNATVLGARAEDLPSNEGFSARMACVTARAVGPLPMLWAYARPLLQPSGCLLAMKGPGPLSEFERGIPANIQCDVAEIDLPITGRARTFVTVRQFDPA